MLTINTLTPMPLCHERTNVRRKQSSRSARSIPRRSQEIARISYAKPVSGAVQAMRQPQEGLRLRPAVVGAAAIVLSMRFGLGTSVCAAEVVSHAIETPDTFAKQQENNNAPVKFLTDFISTPAATLIGVAVSAALAKNDVKNLREDFRGMKNSMKDMATNKSLEEIKETIKTLATKESVNEVKETIKELATKESLDEVRETIKGLATKESLDEVKETLKTLATKESLANFATKDDIRNLATREEVRSVNDRIDDSLNVLAGDLRRLQSEKRDRANGEGGDS